MNNVSLKELSEEYYQSADRLLKQIKHFNALNKDGKYNELISVLRQERYDALCIAQYLGMRSERKTS